MIYQESKFLLLAGPCSLECEALSMEVAAALSEIALRHSAELTVVFKGSFDKANRTSIHSKRGPGLQKGMEILAAVKSRYGFPVVTDVHEASQCAEAASVCDVLQIPAFLSRQTDLLEAAAKTGRTVNVKKGQFLSPSDMRHVVSKLREAQATEIWQTERGSSFGYNNLVVDMRGFPIMAANSTPVLLDATHSTQLPGAGDGVSSGQREYAPLLARAAVAAGADGLFVETHPCPQNALSDAATQLPLEDMPALVKCCIEIWRLVKNNKT